MFSCFFLVSASHWGGGAKAKSTVLLYKEKRGRAPCGAAQAAGTGPAESTPEAWVGEVRPQGALLRCKQARVLTRGFPTAPKASTGGFVIGGA